MSKDGGKRGPNPFRLAPASCPPRWARIVIYGLTWLPGLWGMFIYTLRFEPIFKALKERDELPAVTALMLKVAQFNASCLYVPAVALFSAIFVLDEIMIGRLCRNPRPFLRSWFWVIAVGLVGLLLLPPLVFIGITLPLREIGMNK
jgi:hypothetical protein